VSWPGRLLLVVALALGLYARVQVGQGFTGYGQDSYFYLLDAEELRLHHTYGHLCRMPGYATFLAAVATVADEPARPEPPFFAAAKRAQWGIDLAAALLVFFIARRLGGHAAAWPALAIALANPMPLFATGTILTETLATALTAAALAPLVVGALPCSAARARRLLIAAAALIAIAALVRADAWVLAGCLLVAVALRPEPPATRAWTGFLAVAVLLALFAPWPLHNRARTGAAMPLGALCDNTGRALPRGGYLHWMATWLVDEAQLPSTTWAALSPWQPAPIGPYPVDAFDSDDERNQVAALLERRLHEGFSDDIDAAFDALAQARARRHPWHRWVALPVERAWRQWTHRLPATAALPWPAVTGRVRPYLAAIGWGIDLAALAGLALLLADRRWRAAGLVALVALAGRSAALAVSGLVEARYLVELAPLEAVLAGVAVAAVVRLLR
jgi:hypothetical protein